MICTESEAKEKWCPQVRFVPILEGNALSPANRLGPERGPDLDNPHFSRCIGSACMMWNWEDYENETVSIYVGHNHTPHQPGRALAEQHLLDGWEEYNNEGTDYRAFKRPMGETRRGTCGFITKGAQ